MDTKRIISLITLLLILGLIMFWAALTGVYGGSNGLFGRSFDDASMFTVGTFYLILSAIYYCIGLTIKASKLVGMIIVGLSILGTFFYFLQGTASAQYGLGTSFYITGAIMLLGTIWIGYSSMKPGARKK